MKRHSMKETRPLAGVGVLVIRDGKAPLARRKGSHGDGEYSFPGGYLELGESFEECARREVLEETGMKIKNVRFQYLGNLKKYNGKHHVQIGLIAEWKSGEPRCNEPHKSEKWEWFDINDLPEPLFEPCRIAFNALKSGKNYFDY